MNDDLPSMKVDDPIGQAAKPRRHRAMRIKRGRTVRWPWFVFGIMLLAGAALYVFNPGGTASTDPRARILGFAAFSVSSESMAPTLMPGNLIGVSTWAFRRALPARGDIVAIQVDLDRANRSTPETYVMRVIGLPREHVVVANDSVRIDDALLDEPYVADGAWEGVKHAPVTLTVPPGQVFLLGDNRGNSRDSRVLGPLAADQLVGRVFRID